MKQYSKKLFSLVVLCSTTSVLLQADCCNNNNNSDRVIPFIQWRSQGRDMARKLYGETSYAIYQADMDGMYGTFNATVQYDQSFRGSDLAKCLFGNSLVSNPAGTTTTTTNNCNNSCDDVLVISGLNNATRAKTEWMAENFYLPRDFKSTITFSPKVQDVVVDFHLYVGFDRWVKGMYFRLYGPFAWNKANLRAEENIINKGTATTFNTATPPAITAINGGYEQGYFNVVQAVPTQSLFSQALNFFGGCTPTALEGNTIEPLKFAKFAGCNLTTTTTNKCDDVCGSSNTKTGFAELRGELGWNYIQEKYRFLLNIQAAAPTGSRPNGEYLFPAQVGNGKHWELGVGLGGAWKMWGSEDGEKSFNFIVEADITHLFGAKQTLTFDLKNKPNSRYMLAEKLASNTALPATDKLIGASDAGVQFNGAYAPVANFSTREAKVSFGVQGDVVAMFNYTVRGFSWDLGYNFWGLSSSNICLSDSCNDSCPAIAAFPANTWALKGDASVGGYYNPNATTDIEGVALAATESAATIFAGVAATNRNLNIDNPTTGLVNDGVATVNLSAYANPLVVTAATTINTSNKPVFISIDDLDLEGAEQRGLSHKVFTHFSYTWRDRDRWVPYLGAGFSGEFGSHSGSDDCTPTTTTTTTTTANNCPKSVSCALSKWAVEVKGGVSFH